MGWIKKHLEALKKQGIMGIFSQLAIYATALAALSARPPPGGWKYSPPRTFDPMPAVQGALPGGHLTIGNIESLALLAIYSLVALWTIFGWAFLGSIWYLRSANKK